VSASALAQHLDCSWTYIGKLGAEGVIRRQGDGFPLDQSRVAYLRYRRERQQSPRAAVDAEHTLAKTALLRIGIDEKQRKRVRQDDVDELIDQIAGVIHQANVSLLRAPLFAFAGEYAASDGDVFAAGFLGHGDSLRQGMLLAHLGELDEHWKIDSCEHFHLRAHAGNRKVGGCAAEHVGENGDTVATIDAIYRFDDITATQLGVVLGSNGDGFNLFLRTHDVFERRPELVGKAPMGHKQYTNHWKLAVE
jgi:hypothetical protein